MLRRGVLAAVSAGVAGCISSSDRSTVAPSRRSLPTVRCSTERVDGIDVFVREAGPAQAPCVILLHGFPSASHMFRELMPRLAARYRVVAPDYPGFGNSGRPDPKDAALTFEGISRTMERLLAMRGLERYVLFLHDYGGPIGLRMASRSPQRVRGLVVQNANAYDEGLSERFLKSKRPLWDARSAETEAPVAKFIAEGGWRSQYTTGLRNPAAFSPDDANLDAWGLSLPHTLAIQVGLQYDYRDNLARYAEWQAYLRKHRPPTLVVWGKNDPVFLEAGAHAYRRDVPDAEVHLLDTGHFPLQEDTEATASLMLDFLDRRIGGAS